MPAKQQAGVTDKPARGLTPKQAAFVDEYLKDLNATQACIRAGYSAKTADRIGPELLGKTWVASAITDRMKDREKRTRITQDQVLRDLELIKADAMQSIDRDDGKVAMLDRAAAIKAVELQGKHLAMWTDKQRLEGADGGPINLNAVVNFVKP